jgi:hypothetical protein
VAVLETEVVGSVLPCELTPAQVGREFGKLIDRGARIVSAGSCKRDPLRLLSLGYTPKHCLRLFDATFYLANLRYDENFRFFVGHVVLPQSRRARDRSEKSIYPRIFYKDSSLVWRSPSHYIRTQDENWVGKGDLKTAFVNGEEVEYSAEETTNLPLEMQTALDVISRRVNHVKRDDHAIGRVLRKAPEHRFRPYADFAAPRHRARSDPRNRINRGKPVAYFSRENDPSSLRFVRGFEPDFDDGVLSVSRSRSRLYGGDIRKFRILSRNAQIQYQFIAAPRQVWIIPPQTLTTELTSYGVRTIDVEAAEDLFVPGYEYHFIDETVQPPELYTQIPEGFAGRASDVDPSRSDASPWLEEMPVIQRFRSQVLRRC